MTIEQTHVCVCVGNSLALRELFSDKRLYGVIHPQLLLKVGWPPRMEFFLAVFPKVNLLPPPHVSQHSAV